MFGVALYTPGVVAGIIWTVTMALALSKKDKPVAAVHGGFGVIAFALYTLSPLIGMFVSALLIAALLTSYRIVRSIPGASISASANSGVCWTPALW